MLNLCFLTLVLFALFLLDRTKLNKYIGYNKVKEIILVDYNFHPLAKKVFGSEIYLLYNDEVNVNNNVLNEFLIDDYYLVYQSEKELFSTFVGSVFNINKREDCYDLYINLGSENLIIYNLEFTDLKLYQKIEANMVLGYLPFSEDGYYYYYKKY